MRIRFMGLIAHIQDGGDFAALVRAPRHIPKLRVPRKYIVGQPDDDGTVECRPIAGRTIEFSLGKGPANRTGLVNVPNLSVLGAGGATLHADVRAKNAANPADDFESFIELPAGAYGIEDYFEYQAAFGGAIPMACVPRTIIYDTTNAGPAIIRNAGTDIPLKANAVITITNIEPTMAPPASHFGRYGNLFDPPRAIVAPTPGPVCEPPRPPAVPRCPNEPDLSFTVECTNSQYP